MAKTRAIVKRRKAIKNIRKITRTMELIATARYKRAMDRAVEAEAYTRKIAELVADLSRSGGTTVQHPLLATREEVHRSIQLVLTSNRGLCGGYNGNILRVATNSLEERSAEHPVDLEVSGKRGVAFFRYRQVPFTKDYLHFEDKPTYDEVEELANRYLELFLDGAIDRLDVTYMRFISTARQIPVNVTLLPMSAMATEESAEPTGGSDVDYQFMPSAEDILNEIVPVSFKVRLFKCFLDAAVSEQIARMVAMKGATDNAGELIKSLTTQYNRARQGQITSELAEIIGTAEALK